MYSNTNAAVRAYGSMTDTFDVQTGVRQGSILSPFIFNMVVDQVLSAALDGSQTGGVPVEGRLEPLYDLDYADDIVLVRLIHTLNKSFTF